MAHKTYKHRTKGIRAVELFCGIGGFRIACDSLGIRTVWANDLNPLSCSVYQENFGAGEVVEGSIQDLHSQLPPHELLTAGFPCQPFSSAGKKKGIRDPRGTLFEEIAKILKSSAPEFFVLENVKRLLSMEKGDHFATILSTLSELEYLVEWRLLNATSFGLPQNRQRVVIVGRRMKDTDSARISLASHEDLANVIRHDLDGLQDISSWPTIEKHRKRFPTWGLSFNGRVYACDLDGFSSAVETPSLDTILENSPSEDFFMDESTAERIKTSVFVNKLVDGVRLLYNQKGGARMGYTVFGTDGIAPTLTASHSRHYERYKIGSRYRRLTNKEYARLQGFPENHCSGATVFNQYGLYGNAVPPPLARWAIERTISPEGIQIKTLEPVDNSQMSLKL